MKQNKLKGWLYFILTFIAGAIAVILSVLFFNKIYDWAVATNFRIAIMIIILVILIILGFANWNSLKLRFKNLFR